MHKGTLQYIKNISPEINVSLSLFTVEKSAKDWLTEGVQCACGGWRSACMAGKLRGGGGDRLATGLAIAGFL